MIEIRYNNFDEYESLPCEEMLCSVMISSEDETSCGVVYNILKNVFQDNKLVFRATGLPYNIEDVMGIIKNCNPNYFEGDSKKIYIRRYPEIHAEISDMATLKDILNGWVSIATEQRLFYVLKEHQSVDNVFNALKKNVYAKSNHLSLLWPHLNCMVKNTPEAENHNTFILIFREEYFDEIKSLLLNR